MALPATLVWEVRPTDGAVDGGGGVDSALVPSTGTDYSQQDAVQVAYTDLVVGTPNTTVTSVATPFTAAHVGNNIAITTTGGGAAWTTGIYNIRSQAAGVATLDRSPAATASTAGVGNLGGARKGYSNGVTTMQGALVAGNIVHIKGSGQSWNEAVVLTVTGTTAAPIQHIGYNSTRGDNPTGSTRPLNDRNSAGTIGWTSVSENHVRYIQVTRAGTDGVSSNNSTCRFEYCRSYNNASRGFGNIGSFWFCEADLNGSSGIGGNGFVRGFGGFYHDNSGYGFAPGGNSAQIDFCIAANNSLSGILNSSAMQTSFCTSAYNTGTTSDGLNITAQSGSVFLINNIFAFNGRYGINVNGAQAAYTNYNNYYNNATAARNNSTAGENDQTVDPGFSSISALTFTADHTIEEITTASAHGWTINQIVQVSNSGGALPAGLVTNTPYWVLTTSAADKATFSATRGGATKTFTDNGTGTHTVTAAGKSNFAIGTNLKALGAPGVFAGGYTTGYTDIGAVQREEVAGGGGGGMRLAGHGGLAA